MGEVMFSVVIPLYDKAQYIERALRSALAQSVTDFEIVVVDDGSTDGSAALVERFTGARIRLVRQQNAGVSAARNRGIAEARGELIAFLDADDEWKPDFLATISELRARFPDAGIYGTAFAMVTAEQGGRSAAHAPSIGDLQGRLITNYFRAAIDRVAELHMSAVCIPRWIFSELGGFIPGERLGEDLELYCRIAMRYSVAHSARAGSLYYQDIAGSAMDLNIVVEELPFARTARAAIRGGTVARGMVPDLKEFVAEQELWYIRRLVLGGHRATARRMLGRCETSRYRARWAWWSLWARMPGAGTKFAYGLNAGIKRVRAQWSERRAAGHTRG